MGERKKGKTKRRQQRWEKPPQQTEPKVGGAAPSPMGELGSLIRQLGEGRGGPFLFVGNINYNM